MTDLDWAIQQTVHSKRGLSKVIADALGTSQHVVLNKANPENDLNHFNINQVEKLMDVTGNHLVLEVLAERFGYALSKKECKPVDLLNAVLCNDKEQGDVSESISQAIADGRVTPAEMREVRSQIHGARDSLDKLEASFDQYAQQH